MKKTIVYVDGFNFYYGAVRNTPYKWLDIHKLCQTLLTQNEIIEIKYFTALVSSRPDDHDQPIRQQIYLRALRTLPNFKIIFGHFSSHPIFLPLAKPGEDGKLKYVEVLKTEEKGSDVNLATHILTDGFQNRYDAAVLLSNDSDLAEPIHYVREHFGKVIGLLNPHDRPSQVLVKHAHFVKSIRPNHLRKSLFPDPLTDAKGTFTKPHGW